MQSGQSFESHPTDFTLSCPGFKGPRNVEDHSGGHLTFTIGNAVVAHIGYQELIESWQAASSLSASEALSMTETAGRHLSQILEHGLGGVDLSEAATDAAVILLLAMRRQGVSDPKRIPACTVMWNGQEGRERVLLSA